MPTYLLQVAYTSDSWSRQVKNPQNVVDRVRGPIAELGGSIESCYYAFGETDLVAIVQFPDNESAAAFSIAAAAGGAVKSLTTTPLMAVEEGMSAMRRAATSSYRPAS